ncbi:MAG: hypothetical protein ACRDVZ_07200 [Jiangellaceae bacterium]
MRKSLKGALLAGAVTVAVAVPVGAAFGGTEDEPSPPTSTQTERPGPGGPPAGAPEECQEHFDSPEMRQYREEHHDAGGHMNGRMGGRMWDGATG